MKKLRGTVLRTSATVKLLSITCLTTAYFTTIANAATVTCAVSVTRLDGPRTKVHDDSKVIPTSKSTPDSTVLYQWGTNQITADFYLGGDLGIVWNEKPFGFRSGTFEPGSAEKRHFFIEDPNAGIGVDIHCVRE